MEQWNTHEGIAEEKALVLLSELHALWFPGMKLHRRRFRRSEREYLPLDAEYVHEEVLTREGLNVAIKEEIIRAQFQRLFPKRVEVPLPGSVYAYVLDVCETARRRFHAEKDLVDSEGYPLSSEAVLPGPEVIEAMAEDFVRHKREHCPQLEEFIVQTQSAA